MLLYSFARKTITVGELHLRWAKKCFCWSFSWCIFLIIVVVCFFCILVSLLRMPLSGPVLRTNNARWSQSFRVTKTETDLCTKYIIKKKILHEVAWTDTNTLRSQCQIHYAETLCIYCKFISHLHRQIVILFLWKIFLLLVN